MVARLTNKPRFSVIVPVLNEAQTIISLLRALHAQVSSQYEMVVVDGGSQDATSALVHEFQEKHPTCSLSLLESERGRARQMNVGAAHAKGDYLVFLHADSSIPPEFAKALEGLASEICWGRFDVRLDDERAIFKLIGRMINWRSGFTGIATGDQTIFVKRAVFEQIGGYPDQPLMEDVELSKRLRRREFPHRIKYPAMMTSARKWREEGVWRTIFLMWRLRAAYALGANPQDLVRRYYRGAN